MSARSFWSSHSITLCMFHHLHQLWYLSNHSIGLLSMRSHVQFLAMFRLWQNAKMGVYFRFSCTLNNLTRLSKIILCYSVPHNHIVILAHKTLELAIQYNIYSIHMIVYYTLHNVTKMIKTLPLLRNLQREIEMGKELQEFIRTTLKIFLTFQMLSVWLL